MTEPVFPNDFHRDDPDTTRWALSDRRETVEERRYTIRVSDLKKIWRWDLREDLREQEAFLLGKIKVKPVKDKIHRDWYLELVNPGPRCSNTTISFKHSRCNYGGHREWFQCPECYERVGVLYRDKDNFKCRKCLGLIYQKQKMNYGGIHSVLENALKLEKMSESKKRFFYAGRDTKWFKKYKDLSYKVGNSMNVVSKIMAKEKWSHLTKTT